MTNNVTALTVEDVLVLTQSDSVAPSLDAAIDTWQATQGFNDRQMLRAAYFVLRSIATTMPWDEPGGLDIPRLNQQMRALFPSWRECIGAVLGLEFSKPQASNREQTPSEDEARDVGAEQQGI